VPPLGGNQEICLLPGPYCQMFGVRRVRRSRVKRLRWRTPHNMQFGQAADYQLS
jgi:hypothetical protein